MLVLTRKDGDSVLIGDDIRITVFRDGYGKMKLGIEAPKSVSIMREELVTGEQAEPDRSDRP